MWIVKIGGSLFEHPDLFAWLRVICQHGSGKVVIVPGGGDFADQVRDKQSLLKFNDHIAHRMALRSMDQYGLVITGIGYEDDLGDLLIPASSTEAISDALATTKIPIWLPSQMLDLESSIPQNWDMTSDSLAAWLAQHLNADQLIMVKILEVTVDLADWDTLEKESVIDPLFRRYSQNKAFSTQLLRADQYTSMQELLVADNLL